MISNIVFTKNRPLQLHGYFESLDRYFPAELIQTCVIYKVEMFRDEYERLFRKFPTCVVIEEKDFPSDFLRVLDEVKTPYILFGIDDVVYFDSVDLDIIDRTFREHGEDIVGFTLRFGVDMQDGRGVDVVMDLTEGFEQVDKALGRRRFGTIFCLSVLEHCRELLKMAENLMRLLKPGGIYPAKENDEKLL